MMMMQPISHSDPAAQIKSNLSMWDVATRYGYDPGRGGYIACPFHAEKTASLKIYKEPGRGWHCYGCGAGGSVIDFVMRLFQINFRQAILRINADFGLGITPARPDPVAVERRRQGMAFRDTMARLARAQYSLAITRYWIIRNAMARAEPYSDAWCWAAHEIDAAEAAVIEAGEVKGWSIPKKIL